MRKIYIFARVLYAKPRQNKNWREMERHEEEVMYATKIVIIPKKKKQLHRVYANLYLSQLPSFDVDSLEFPFGICILAHFK